MQSSSQIITTSTPTPIVLQAGCPSSRPTNSVRALKLLTYLLQATPLLDKAKDRELQFDSPFGATQNNTVTILRPQSLDVSRGCR